MAEKYRDAYFDREKYGNKEVSEAFDFHVESVFKRIMAIKEYIFDSKIAPWHRYLAYELSLIDFRLDIKRALEVLQYCTLESISKNEKKLRSYFSDYQKFSQEIVGYVINNIKSGNFIFTREQLFSQIDEITAYATGDFFEKYFFTLEADKDSPLSTFSRVDNDNQITVVIDANRTIDDVKWFIDNRLADEFRKHNRSNTVEKRLNMSEKTFERDMLINFLLSNYVRPVQIEEYLRRLIPDLCITSFDINKMRSKILRVNDDWFRLAYLGYEEIFERSDEIRQKICRFAMVEMSKEHPNAEDCRFLELDFDENPKPHFFVRCVL